MVDGQLAPGMFTIMEACMQQVDVVRASSAKGRRDRFLTMQVELSKWIKSPAVQQMVVAAVLELGTPPLNASDMHGHVVDEAINMALQGDVRLQPSQQSSLHPWDTDKRLSTHMACHPVGPGQSLLLPMPGLGCANACGQHAVWGMCMDTLHSQTTAGPSILCSPYTQRSATHACDTHCLQNVAHAMHSASRASASPSLLMSRLSMTS